ncbi:hypothetical protein WL88_08020 [Burkholderia diffusa]|uniref:Uncharacterized protein n=1 Tax=Burkholderia diffusa TaxID=488732 RepID=A0AAW3PKJ2_9BURK|nr:hypothetical protein WJ39_12045 [Burkholderia diffusa]KWF27332.1 hypothetical protein WL85_29525 [Burkholderia diffusa]KWF43744.1 hypothetical protein WL86_09430 [Burkholderia diffusa]KWF54604.1 hypothetical protein WL87_09520 [Burkholderia diffusa]KWF57481.1 hypothetical protein WL88_08020 [Burkholderia diffusa]
MRGATAATEAGMHASRGTAAHAMPHRRASRPVIAHRDVARRQCCSAPHLCLAASRRIARRARRPCAQRPASLAWRGCTCDSGRHGTAFA